MADFMVAGTRYRETFDTLEQAEKWEADTRHALKFGKPLPPVSNGRSETGGRLETLGKLRDHVVKHTWAKAKGSQSQIVYSKQLVDHLGAETLVADVTKFMLQEACEHFLSEGNTIATVNRKMSCMSKMLTEAVEHGVIQKKPGIPKGKELNIEIRFLTPDEEQRLIERFSHVGLQDWAAFVEIGIDTGMRLGEMMRLRWDHLGPQWDIMHIWETKTNQPRSLFATARVKRNLQALQDRYPMSQGPFFHFRKDNALRRNLRDQWDQVTGQVHVEKRIHDLRHTCASRLVQKGVDLLRVKQWMGHSDITTTLRYAHLAPNDLEVCRKALEL